MADLRPSALAGSARAAVAIADPVGYWSRVPAVRAVRERYKRSAAPEGWFLMAVGPIVGLLIALWMTVPDWGPRPSGGADALAQVIRVQFAANHLINHGLVDGWSPSFIVGYAEFLFDGPGLSWAAYLVHLITFGTLSFTGAIKLIAVGSFAVLPLIVAFTARSFSLNRRAAGVAGIVSLLIDCPYGGAGLSGLFSNGLITNGFGALFFFLTLGGFARALRQRQARWVIFTAVNLAILILTHGISVMELGVLLPIVILLWLIGLHFPNAGTFYARAVTMAKAQLQAEARSKAAAPGGAAGPSRGTPLSTDAIDEPRKRSWSCYQSSLKSYWPPFSGVLIALLLGFALSAVVLLPLEAHDNIRGPTSGWTTSPFGQLLLNIWRGAILLRPGTAPFLLAGAAYGVFRVWKGRPFAIPVVAAPILFILVGDASLHYWTTNILTYQLTNRGLGYAGILATFPLAALIARATRGLLLRDVLAVAIAAALVILPMGNQRQEAQENPQAIPQMFKAVQILKSLVPTTARFASEQSLSDLTETGVPYPDDWLAWASGRNTLDTFNIESAQAVGMSNVVYNLGAEPASESADDLAQAGVTDVVTVTPETAKVLASSPRFHEVWGSVPIAVFAVLPSPGQPSPSALITARAPLKAALVAGGPEYDEINVDASTATQATLATAYSPDWHASLDGKAVPLTESPQGLLQLDLPAGPYSLKVTFERDFADYMGLAISLATLLSLLAYGVVRWRGRRTRKETQAAGFTTIWRADDNHLGTTPELVRDIDRVTPEEASAEPSTEN